MAIEKEIPRDISKIDTKFAGPFTARNLIFGVPGLALGVGCYFLLKPFVPNDVNFFIDMTVALPLLACGWLKPYGIPLEKYISIVFVSMVLAPKHRKYKTENLYDDLREKKMDETASVKDSKKQKKKNRKNRNDLPEDLKMYE